MRPRLILIVLLLLSEILYLALVRINAINGTESVLSFLAIFGSLFLVYGIAARTIRREKTDQRAFLFLIALGALLFRITLLPAGLPHDRSPSVMLSDLKSDLSGEAVSYEPFLLYDSDLWRYLWDGHVWANKINPYRFAPSDPELDSISEGIWSDIRDNVNHPDIRTIYPPFAQLASRLSYWMAPGSVLAWKALLIFVDLLVIFFIALSLHALRRPITEVLLYAWNPMILKVIAGSGHVDVLVAASLAATAYFVIREWKIASVLTFGLAVLAKFSPLILLPFVAKRTSWKKAGLIFGLIVISYAPFADAGTAIFDGLHTFGREWQFNAGPFVFVQGIASAFTPSASSVARSIQAFLILSLIFWLTKIDDGRMDSFTRNATIATGSLIVLSPAVMPWYITWILPFAILARQRIWVYFSALLSLAFLVMIDGTESPWVLFVEYGSFAFLLWREFGKRKVLRTFATLGNKKWNRIKQNSFF